MKAPPRRSLPCLLPAYAGALGLLVLASLLLRLENPTSLGDGIRHLTLVRLLARGEIAEFHGWGDVLFTGYFSTRNVDPWYLTHTVLLPLGFLPLIPAQNSLILGMSALLAGAFLFAIRACKLSPLANGVLVLLLLLGNMQFSMRLMLGRPLFLMAALTLLCLACILERRAFAVGALLCVATLLSHLFFFPLAVALCGVLWLWSSGEKRMAAVLLACAAAGTGAGLLLHPDSAQYFHYFTRVFLRIPLLTGLPVGTEMQSGFDRMGMPIAAYGLAALFILVAKNRHSLPWSEMHQRGLTLTGGICIAMLLGMAAWVRMLDFLWPLLLVFVAQALSLSPALARETVSAILPRKAIAMHAPAVAMLMILTVHTVKLHVSFVETDHERSLAEFAGPLSGMAPGSRVLNLDWDLFPSLFSVRPDLLYARGMDPSYDYIADPASTILFLPEMSELETQEQRGAWLQTLEERFQPDYLAVWADKNTGMLQKLLATDDLVLVSKSERLAVFKTPKYAPLRAEDSV